MGRANSKSARIKSLKGGGFGDAYRKAAAKLAGAPKAAPTTQLDREDREQRQDRNLARSRRASGTTSYAPASSIWNSMVHEARNSNLSTHQFGASAGKHAGSYSPEKDIAGVARNGSVAYGKHAAGGPKNTHRNFDWFSH